MIKRTKLPSVWALAVDVHCSVVTTRSVYQDLEAEGFIRTRQGMGTVVAEMPEETMGPHRREAVEAAMGEAIETGQRAGLTEEELRENVGSLRIPTGSRKAALVHLALEAWRAGLINPRAVGEVRGRAMMRRRRDD